MRTCEVEWKRFHYHPKDMLHARSNRHVGASFLWAMMHVMVASSKVRNAPEMSQDPPSPFNPPNSICATGDESASRELQGMAGGV